MATYADTIKKLLERNPNGKSAETVAGSSYLKDYIQNPAQPTAVVVPSSQAFMRTQGDEVTPDRAPNSTLKSLIENQKTPFEQKQGLYTTAGVPISGNQIVPEGVTKPPEEEIVKPPEEIKKEVVTPTSTVTDNSAMIKQGNQALIDALKARLQQNINAKNVQISQLGQTYDPLRAQSEVRKAQELRTSLEQSANMGDRGGIGRQNALETQTAGEQRLNAIDLQQQTDKQNLMNDIANLTLEGDIQTAQYKAQELKDLIAEQNRVSDATYARSRDTLADTRYADEVARQKEQTAYSRSRDTLSDTRYADEAARQKEQTAYERAQAEASAKATAEKQAKADAWDRVNSIGYVDAQSAQILGLPEGTIPLEAQKTLQALKTGEIDQQTAQYKLDELTNPNSVTNQLNRLDVALKNQDLKKATAEYNEWVKQAPLRTQQINADISKARTANAIALVEKKIADEELIAKKLETKNMTQQQKDEHAKVLQSLAESKAQIANQAAQLGISQAELKLAMDKFNYDKTQTSTKTIEYSSNPKYQENLAMANDPKYKDSIYKQLTNRDVALDMIKKYGPSGYKSLLSASAPKGSLADQIIEAMNLKDLMTGGGK